MRRNGFSLVELSIVLVILGLLVGGILAGRSLIRAAELRSVASDVQRYRTAAYSFRDKYFTLPGDMPNATSIWGALDGNDGLDVDCTELPSTGLTTCNGNGDGRISGVGTTYYYESFRFWHHLANAGLVEGRYTGMTGTGSGIHCVIGTNCPGSRIAQAGFGILYYATTANGQFVAPHAHQLIFGGQHASSPPIRAIIRAEEAWNIDSKMDDGQPATGSVTTANATARPDCTSNDTLASAYLLDNTTNGCNLFFTFR